MKQEYLQYLLDEFEARNLSALEYEAEGFRLRLEKQFPPAGIQAPPFVQAPPYGHAQPPAQSPSYGQTPSAAQAPSAAPPPMPVSAGEPAAGHMIESPIVGTFYSAPSPDAPDFTAAGRSVEPGDVLCIVEAMKTMNEIECDVSGVVTAVLARNGQLVEYKQPLFEITPHDTEPR